MKNQVNNIWDNFGILVPIGYYNARALADNIWLTIVVLLIAVSLMGSMIIILILKGLIKFLLIGICQIKKTVSNC